MSSKRIIISRTDSIGDVILTLPVAGFLKTIFPTAELIFLGRNYTRDVVALSTNIDHFVSWDEVENHDVLKQINFLKEIKADTILHIFPKYEIARAAYKAKILNRIGSTGRIYHYRYCNKLVKLSRKNSSLHEAQLNFKLLKPLIGKVEIPTLEEIQKYYGFQKKSLKDDKIAALLDQNKFNIILHPKSKGSAREWPLNNYSDLINLLPEEHFKIFITGTNDEGKLMQKFLAENKTRITDLTGKFSLKELIAFIAAADGLLAASTGPLHLAAAMGKITVGIYPSIQPMDPGRWAPVGKNAHFLVKDKKCSDCRNSLNCHCINEISPQQVSDLIIKNV